MDITYIKSYFENCGFDHSYDKLIKLIEKNRKLGTDSVEQIAKKIGYSRATYYNFESGKNVNSDIFLEIVYFYGLRLWSEDYPGNYMNHPYEITGFIKKTCKAKFRHYAKLAEAAGVKTDIVMRLSKGQPVCSKNLFQVLEALGVEWRC